MIVQEIYKYLEDSGKSMDSGILDAATERFQTVVKKDFMRDRKPKKGKIYPSQAGKDCARALAYKFWGFEKTNPAPSRKKIDWFTSSLVELGIVTLAQLAGVDLDLNNEYLRVDIDGWEVWGAIDGLLYYNGEPYVMECKAMNSYSYDRARKEGVGNRWGYLSQINLYMDALNVSKGVFVLYNKNTGHLHEQEVGRDEAALEKARENAWEVLESNPKDLPPRFRPLKSYDYMPQREAYQLGTTCSYCDYVGECYGDRLAIDQLKSGPKFRVEMEPELALRESEGK